MAFKLGPINFNAVAQGVGGLVFGNSDQASKDDDGGVEQLLERISNGVLAEDRRQAMAELQDLVAENLSAKLAFGAIGLPVILSVLREERNDLDLIRGGLETLVNALATTEGFSGNKSQVQPAVVNSELLAREPGSASLLLSLLEEEDFYVRYYTLRLLTTLSTNCSVRLQEAILTTPQGITRLMDMMQDREVIRNEALLLLTHLTRSAEEIQKIAVFEGAFEKIFNIIIEEGGSDGGIVVQDCLELLNNILRTSASNQTFLRETLGLQPVASLLKLRRSSAHSFSQQKVVNLLCILETVMLLLAGSTEKEPGKDSNLIANQTVLAQNNLLDYLLALSVEGRVSASAVRCTALRCIGDLIFGHARNRDLLGSKIVGDEPEAEPALNCILRMLLNTSDMGECIAAEYVIKCFCEGNPDGQIVLASTITPISESNLSDNKALENHMHISFGRILLSALNSGNTPKNIEATCRAICVLTHILRDNLHCKERVLQISLEIPASSLVPPDYLLLRCMKYLAAVSQSHTDSIAEDGKIWLQPILLRLLVTWLADCPAAVASFLEPAAHITYLIELLTSSVSPVGVHVSGLAAVLLGECIVYNTSDDPTKSASMVVDVISQRVGLTTYFSIWEALQSNAMFLSATASSRLPKPLTWSSVAAVASGNEHTDSSDPINGMPESEDSETGGPVVTSFYDSELVKLTQKLDPIVRERVVQLFSQPKAKPNFTPILDRKAEESESDFILRLQTLVRKQSQELQEIMSRNSVLVEELVNRGGMGSSSESSLDFNKPALTKALKESLSSSGESDTLRQQIQEYQLSIQDLGKRQNETEAELLMYKQLAAKHEGDLKSLSDAYNSLEQENYQLDLEVRKLRSAVQGTPTEIRPGEIEAAKEEGRQEALKDHEAEMSDLLVCLGQEESKVEKLRARLLELGEDVEALLEGIGEEPEGDDEEEDD